MIDNGAMIDAKDHRNGYGPLHVAIDMNKKAMVQLLLKKGANINLTSNNNETPLMLSVAKGHLAIGKLLIQHGADLELTESEGFSALHEAADLGNVEFAKALIYNGANINVKDDAFFTPLLLAVEQSHPKMVNLLTMCDGIDMNVKNGDGATALEIALNKKNMNIGKVLAYSGMK